MSHFAWEEVITELERASDRLIAAMPANNPLMEDALKRRAEAIVRLGKITDVPDAAVIARLEKAIQAGDKAREQLILGREQLRDGLARLNHSAYLTQTFNGKEEETGRGFDCNA